MFLNYIILLWYSFSEKTNINFEFNNQFQFSQAQMSPRQTCLCVPRNLKDSEGFGYTLFHLRNKNYTGHKLSLRKVVKICAPDLQSCFRIISHKMTEKVFCPFYNVGYCKYKDKCSNEYAQPECDKKKMHQQTLSQEAPEVM